MSDWTVDSIGDTEWTYMSTGYARIMTWAKVKDADTQDTQVLCAFGVISPPFTKSPRHRAQALNEARVKLSEKLAEFGLGGA